MDVNQYEAVSGGVIKASCEKVETGATITLGLFPPNISFVKNLFLGGSMKSSDEEVILDAENRYLGWKRGVPFSSEVSERWQIIVAKDDKKCVYFSGLYLPSAMGLSLTAGEIKEGFQALANGLKQQVEK
jgi:hypothetical protein